MKPWTRQEIIIYEISLQTYIPTIILNFETVFKISDRQYANETNFILLNKKLQFYIS